MKKKSKTIPSCLVTLQDLEDFDNTKQISAILFHDDIYDFPLHEHVIFKGVLHKVQNNDRVTNKRLPCLFVDYIDREAENSEKESIRITPEDIEEFKAFVADTQW